MASRDVCTSGKGGSQDNSPMQVDTENFEIDNKVNDSEGESMETMSNSDGSTVIQNKGQDSAKDQKNDAQVNTSSDQERKLNISESKQRNDSSRQKKENDSKSPTVEGNRQQDIDQNKKRTCKSGQGSGQEGLSTYAGANQPWDAKDHSGENAVAKEREASNAKGDKGKKAHDSQKKNKLEGNKKKNVKDDCSADSSSESVYSQKNQFGHHKSSQHMAAEEWPDSRQIQMQKHIQRSMEASKQMLYGVYGNVISMLEEFEQRELEQSGQTQLMPRSKIPIPSQKHKRHEDIKRLVEGQLFMFENQTGACPPEAFSELKYDMRRRTISWAAVRWEMGVKETQQTDQYIAKLYEILVKGSIQHYIPERCNASPDVIKTGFEAIMKGNHDKEYVDASFRGNADMKAIAPETRSSEMLLEGARRISQANGRRELDYYLKMDLEQFKKEGPLNLK